MIGLFHKLFRGLWQYPVPSLLIVICLGLIGFGGTVAGRHLWAESHYRWQIRTFWFAVLWFAIAVVLIVTIIGMVIGFPILGVLTLWLVYRIVRGWLRLRDRRPMYV